MVYLHKEASGLRAAWLDGGVPSKRNLVHKCSLKRLCAGGIEKELLGELAYAASKRGRSSSRFKLLVILAAAFTKKHMDFESKSRQDYQIVLFRPKWSKAERRKEVQRAHFVRYDTERFFPEDDPLLDSIKPEEIVHIRPYIPYLRESDYFQLLAIYPASSSDWIWDHVSGDELQSEGPIGQLAAYLDIKTPPARSYHNFPVLDKQVRALLRESMSHHLKGEGLLRFLQERGFITVEQYVSLQMGSQADGRRNQA